MAISKTYKRNDTGPPITITCLDGTNPKDLTAATAAKFLMGTVSALGVATVKAQGTMAFDETRESGKVTYDWGTTDLDTPGEYKVEVEITYSNGKKQTFPSEGYLTVTVLADLG